MKLLHYIGIFIKTLLRCLLKPLSFVPALVMMYVIFGLSAQDGQTSGQLSYKVFTNGTDLGQRVSIHVPTFRNAPTLPVMLRGNTVADAGLIVASIDPCFSCMDR